MQFIRNVNDKTLKPKYNKYIRAITVYFDSETEKNNKLTWKYMSIAAIAFALLGISMSHVFNIASVSYAVLICSTMFAFSTMSFYNKMKNKTMLNFKMIFMENTAKEDLPTLLEIKEEDKEFFEEFLDANRKKIYALREKGGYSLSNLAMIEIEFAQYTAMKN